MGLIYYVHVGTKLLSPIVVSAPNGTSLVADIKVQKPVIINGMKSYYKVYTPAAEVLLRYRHRWEVNFTGRIDHRDITKLTFQINGALNAKLTGLDIWLIFILNQYLAKKVISTSD